MRSSRPASHQLSALDATPCSGLVANAPSASSSSSNSPGKSSGRPMSKSSDKPKKQQKKKPQKTLKERRSEKRAAKKFGSGSFLPADKRDGPA